MDWSKPSKELFDYVRALPFTHILSGLDYWIEKDGDTLYVAFAESNSAKAMGDNDWTANFDFFPATFDLYTGIKAHHGIAQQYLGIRQLLMDCLYGGTVRQIYIAGFSLGGALTVAAVQDIGYHIDRDGLDVSVFGISFDGPRFFCWPNGLVKRAVKGRLLLVKTRCDPVVHVPCKIMLMPFTWRLRPFEIRLVLPNRWLSFWADYGRKVWIGKLWRVLPIQHYPSQVGKALLEKFGA